MLKIEIMQEIDHIHSEVTEIEWSPDGNILAIGYRDCFVRLWDTNGIFVNEYGLPKGEVNCISWSPDSCYLAAGSDDHYVYIWEISNNKLFDSIKHNDKIFSIAWSKSGKFLATGSKDKNISIYDIKLKDTFKNLKGHKDTVFEILWLSNDNKILSVSGDSTIKIWNVKSESQEITLCGHSAGVGSACISHDEKIIATGSDDQTIRLWEISSGKQLQIIENHLGSVDGLKFSNDGRFLASMSSNMMILWDTNNWEIVEKLEGDSGWWIASGLAFHPKKSAVAIRQKCGKSVAIFEYKKICPSKEKQEQHSLYKNAKIVFLGESGVGKTGLALRLTKGKFHATISTDAHWISYLKIGQSSGSHKELWLWDFGGQADYRLIQQLFMGETALAVLVFNPQSENLFEGLGQWDHDLTRATKRRFTKLLVAGRCDRGGLRVSREIVEAFARQQGFVSYLETSALTGEGCDKLRDEVVRRIDWDAIPYTATPRIFKLLKDEILRLRDKGVVLLRMGELMRQMEIRLSDEAFSLDELLAVVGLLASPGLVWKLKFGDIVMLQPEWINKYVAAVIRSVRAHIGEIGVIGEAQVLEGDLNYTIDVHQKTDDETESSKATMQRLNPADEAIVLRALHQMLVDHGLCVREETEDGGRQLIFPSYFKKEMPTGPGHPPSLVKYQFHGNAEEIYATLVVQLWQTRAFENGDLWRNAADFKSPTGARLGLKMIKGEDNDPEISVYFNPGIPDDTKVTFIKYVHEHLLAKAQGVVRLRFFVCPYCRHPVRDAKLAREILDEEGQNAEIRCQQRKCDKRFPLWDVIEQKFASEAFQELVRELGEKAKATIDNESRELMLEGHVRVITGEAGQIYRGYTGSDHGIDGEIELKNDLGQASGKRLYLQLKSGDSYLYRRKSDGEDVFQIKKQRWATYWCEQAYPVLLIIRTSDGKIRWMNVTEYLDRKDWKTPVTQIVFDGQPFTALSLHRLRDRILINVDK